jgi:hypothetical protein
VGVAEPREAGALGVFVGAGLEADRAHLVGGAPGRADAHGVSFRQAAGVAAKLEHISLELNQRHS